MGMSNAGCFTLEQTMHLIVYKCIKYAKYDSYTISNSVVCATSKASDQPAHARSLIRAFASRLSIL